MTGHSEYSQAVYDRLGQIRQAYLETFGVRPQVVFETGTGWIVSLIDETTYNGPTLRGEAETLLEAVGDLEQVMLAAAKAARGQEAG